MAWCFPRFPIVLSFVTLALGVRTALALRGEDNQKSHAQLVVQVDPSDPSGDSDKSDEETTVMETPEDLELESLDEFLDGIIADIEAEEEDEDEDELEWSPEELDEIMAKAKDNADKLNGSEKVEKPEELEILSTEEIEDLLRDVNNEVGLEEEEGDQDQDDEACTFHSDSDNLMDWLRETKNAKTEGCQDFGPRFGQWGAQACPSLTSIIEDLEAGTKEATGGKSGTKPIVSKRFAVKLIDDIEHKMLHKLLHSLKGSRRDSFLVPTCRSLCLKVSGKSKLQYVQITPNILLRGDSKPYFTRLLDLKGNYAWRSRVADPIKDFVWKDTNFKHMFPNGLNLTQVMFPNGKGGFSTFTGDLAASYFARTLYSDSRQLAKLGLMDYSLLLHASTYSKKKMRSADLEANLKKLNPGKPWGFATAMIHGKEKIFAISWGIIDLLMHENENRGFMNKFASGFQMSECRVTDLDPIPALPYWIRFCRMFGVQQKYRNSKRACVSCLGESPGQGYTYFPSRFEGPRFKTSLSC